MSLKVIQPLKSLVDDQIFTPLEDLPPNVQEVDNKFLLQEFSDDEQDEMNTRRDTKTIVSHKHYSYSKNAYKKKRISRLGPFLLLKTIGVGEFGKVKLARHIQTGQIVAIKLVKRENIDSSQLDKIQTEINILKTLNHPYIVKLLSVNETSSSIGMVLEYAPGGELFEYIYKERYLKEDEARRLFAQLISSVYYMHKKNIVHRDLKLENILLDHQRNIIVTDFGFANQFTSTTGNLMSTSCGSPVYAAPELVMTGRLYVGTSVDIWSCGIILYAMLCGYLPFDDDVKNPNGDNIGRLYRYIMSHKPKYPQHLSHDAKDIISQMLVPDPSERCDLETIICHPWLEDYREEASKSIRSFEEEAKNRRMQLLEGIESTTHLDILTERGSTLSGEGHDQSDHEPYSSTSSSYIYSSSCTKEDDKEIHCQQQDELSISSEIMAVQIPLPLNEDQQKTEEELASPVEKNEKELPTESTNKTVAVNVENRVTAIELSSSKSTEDQKTYDDVLSKQNLSETSQLQQLSLRARLLSTVKRRSVSSSTPSIKPMNDEKPINKSRNSWQHMIHRNSTKEATAPIAPPLLIEQSKNDDKTKVDQKKTRIKNKTGQRSTRPLTKIDKIVEEPSVIAVATPSEENSKHDNLNNTSQLEQESNEKRAWNKPDELELRVHTGPMNRSVLTSKSPMDVLLEITKVLLILGIEVENISGYRLLCTRPAEPQHNEIKDKLNHLSVSCNDLGLSQPIYAHHSIDDGSKIQFSVEICRFENLSGLFSVDIQCLSEGNLSGYQFVGQKLLSLLHFGDVIRNTNFNLSKSDS
ncbi:Serine/threonine-protein kinase KIN4 [Choanephora cucurbitarum]|uniref:Serine/threonine-protein kinase KIN4 n=1 Tax=Choanephora cucurbitarum TaxID=101091 RepID=A0A1C7NMK0_9FUNG|nr:Serine/threonine-protein kinase KIN4 [Choanephora cucurbitarum]